MLLKSCAKCGRLVPYGHRYCKACEDAIARGADVGAADRRRGRQAADRRYNARRDQREVSFYHSKGWRTLQAWRLQQDHYRCRACGRVATQVDHIVPIQTPEGWERRLDPDNTQALCTKCHNAKHDRFGRPRGGQANVSRYEGLGAG